MTRRRPRDTSVSSPQAPRQTSMGQRARTVRRDHELLPNDPERTEQSGKSGHRSRQIIWEIRHQIICETTRAAKGAAALPGKPAKRPGIPWVWASRRGRRTGKTGAGVRPCRTRPRRERRVNRERFSWAARRRGRRRHLSRWRGRRCWMYPASEMGEEMAPVGWASPLQEGELRYLWLSRLFTTRSISSMDARISSNVGAAPKTMAVVLA